MLHRRSGSTGRVLGLFLLVPTGCVAAGLLAAAARGAEEGKKWTDLLEGKDFTKHWNTTGNWKMDPDGSMRLEPRPGESGWSRWDAYLWSKKEYKDFEVEFEYKVGAGGNSGFYFHVGDKNDPVAKGIEVQIYATEAKKETGLNDHDSGGIIPGLPPTKNASKGPKEWNRFHIAVKEGKVTVKLNDVVVNEVPLDNPNLKTRPPKGWIGFQDHALPISLRSIRIREL